MKKFISAFIIGLSICGISNSIIVNPPTVVADDIDKILKAKEIVRNMVNYPDTLVFHDLHTKVVAHVVTLRFTCKNGFGVPQTHTMHISVE
jgi:hypothetical protein